jgi:hypothetical protein
MPAESCWVQACRPHAYEKLRTRVTVCSLSWSLLVGRDFFPLQFLVGQSMLWNPTRLHHALHFQMEGGDQEICVTVWVRDVESTLELSVGKRDDDLVVRIWPLQPCIIPHAHSTAREVSIMDGSIMHARDVCAEFIIYLILWSTDISRVTCISG